MLSGKCLESHIQVKCPFIHCLIPLRKYFVRGSKSRREPQTSHFLTTACVSFWGIIKVFPGQKGFIVPPVRSDFPWNLLHQGLTWKTSKAGHLFQPLVYPGSPQMGPCFLIIGEGKNAVDSLRCLLFSSFFTTYWTAVLATPTGGITLLLLTCFIQNE